MDSLLFSFAEKKYNKKCNLDSVIQSCYRKVCQSVFLSISVHLNIAPLSTEGAMCTFHTFEKSKSGYKDQESIQSSTTPDPRYQWESVKLTVEHHKREPRGQPFPGR